MTTPSQLAPDPAPLILTLTLEPDDQARFDRLREAHFPPERNVVAAHVTLFHHLPGPKADAIGAVLAGQARAQSPFPVAVTGLRSLSRGVAFALESPALAGLRASLARRWAASLTAQDRQGFRPHITVQNKVAPAEARLLFARLSARFAPFTIAAGGLALWRYRGGPWEAVVTFPFTAVPARLERHVVVPSRDHVLARMRP